MRIVFTMFVNIYETENIVDYSSRACNRVTHFRIAGKLAAIKLWRICILTVCATSNLWRMNWGYHSWPPYAMTINGRYANYGTFFHHRSNYVPIGVFLWLKILRIKIEAVSFLFEFSNWISNDVGVSIVSWLWLNLPTDIHTPMDRFVAGKKDRRKNCIT